MKLNPIGNSIYVGHEHKWVELHQDTVVYGAVQWRTDNYWGDSLSLNSEYETSIPLICLICHQEKKKVIHYKRDK